MVKYIPLIILLSGCANAELQAHLEAEEDFHEQRYGAYEFEYIDDCLYYEELVCDFEVDNSF